MRPRATAEAIALGIATGSTARYLRCNRAHSPIQFAVGCILARLQTIPYIQPATLPTQLPMFLTLELEQEADGRWIAEIPDLRGVVAYGNLRDEATARVEALALACWRIGSRTVREGRDLLFLRPPNARGRDGRRPLAAWPVGVTMLSLIRVR